MFAVGDALHPPGPGRDEAVARFEQLFAEYGGPESFANLSLPAAQTLLYTGWRIAMLRGEPGQAHALAARFFTHPEARRDREPVRDWLYEHTHHWMRYLWATAAYHCGDDSEAVSQMGPLLERARTPRQRDGLYMVRAFLLEWCDYRTRRGQAQNLPEGYAELAEEVVRLIMRRKSHRRHLPDAPEVADLRAFLTSTFPTSKAA